MEPDSDVLMLSTESRKFRNYCQALRNILPWTWLQYKRVLHNCEHNAEQVYAPAVLSRESTVQNEGTEMHQTEITWPTAYPCG